MSETTPKTIKGEIALPKLSVCLTMPDDADKPKTGESTEPTTVSQKHSIKIGGAKVDYTSTTGTLAIRDDEGKEKAKFFHVAYTRDGVSDVSKRPLVFAYNGGPGSASVWLHMGCWGPRRVHLGPDGEQPKPPAKMDDNVNTILDVADIVFIDPIGTGYSKAADGVDVKQFHGVEGDLNSVADFIDRYLTENDRWGSPVFLAGESYGTLRSAGLSKILAEEHGIYLNGIVLISTVLNMGTICFGHGNDLPYILFLPTYASTAWYHKALPPEQQARPLRQLLDEVEKFAAGDYAKALFYGDQLPQDEFDNVVRRLAAYTGLSVTYLERSHLRVDMWRFGKELLRDRGLTSGRLDSRYTGVERDDAAESITYDPADAAMTGAFIGAFSNYVRTELKYTTKLTYKYSAGLWDGWDYSKWANTYVDVSESLRSAMSWNPHMKIFCANGYYDLATPYFGTEYTFSHMCLTPDRRANVSMGYYEAGHMMYVKTSELAKLSADVRKFIADCTAE